jgi:hypothetical protein
MIWSRLYSLRRTAARFRDPTKGELDKMTTHTDSSQFHVDVLETWIWSAKIVRSCYLLASGGLSTIGRRQSTASNGCTDLRNCAIVLGSWRRLRQACGFKFHNTSEHQGRWCPGIPIKRRPCLAQVIV